eukprot:15484986-Alexandrium_andersonii.AAC.1
MSSFACRLQASGHSEVYPHKREEMTRQEKESSGRLQRASGGPEGLRKAPEGSEGCGRLRKEPEGSR